MHQAVTGAIIGGVAGGGIAAVTGRRSDPDPAAPPADLGGRVVKGTVSGAMIGASIGLFRDRRAVAAAVALAAEGAEAAKQLVEEAKPMVGSAVVTVRENAGEARRTFEDTVLPAVAEASSRAAESVSSAIDAAQPRLVQLLEQAQQKAEEAQPQIEQLLDRTSDGLDVVIERAKPLAASAADKARQGAELVQARAAALSA
jgi:hypothetical protein